MQRNADIGLSTLPSYQFQIKDDLKAARRRRRKRIWNTPRSRRRSQRRERFDLKLVSAFDDN
jgi:hypothetical protein